MNAIQTEHLTKFYGKTRGIQDVSLSVCEGDFFGFIGPNGAGKSTLIRTLLGLISPTKGRAELFGRDIIKNKIENLNDIGYLPSEAAFYSGMRVGELLKLSADLRKRDCTEQARELCERLELDTARKIDELSLGNRKKVGIVAALQHEPRLYILDEPTSGLDPLMQKEFFTILQERNEQGATIFLSSHVLSEVMRYCNRAAIIREGGLIVSDTIQNLKQIGAKRVVLQGVSLPPLVPGVKHVRAKGKTVQFMYNGRSDTLIRALADLPLEDVSITDPDPEEILMHYYESTKEGN
ncbi:MAG: ABC transporter ATP-binding protein [Clostridia bacterium]|nr:ABC transporter ATP-binding protein [Clostridia bacterium]